MRHARYILAATLIASALCADRAVASVDSTARIESARIVTLAERFAKRFSSRQLRQVASVLRLQQVGRDSDSVDSRNWIVIDRASTRDNLLTAPQLRLPPPLA